MAAATEHLVDMSQQIDIGNLSQSTSQLVVDTMRFSVFQRVKDTVYVIATLPVESKFRTLTGNAPSDTHYPKKVFASPYGVSDGFIFDDTVGFNPGDYCIGLTFDSEAEAESVTAVTAIIEHEPISTMDLSGMIFGLYKALGLDPSHVMTYPVKSVNQSVPFYRKTRADINKVQDNISKIPGQVSELIKPYLEQAFAESKSRVDLTGIQSQLDKIQTELENLSTREKHFIPYAEEKGAKQKTVPLDKYLQLQKEMKQYHDKLKDAEDFIEDLLEDEDSENLKYSRF